MTDLRAFFKANEKHHFNIYEKALYLTIIEGLNGVAVKLGFTPTDLELRSRLGVSQPTLRNARLRLREARLIEFSLGKNQNVPTSYFVKKTIIQVTDNQTGNGVAVKLGFTPTVKNKKTRIKKSPPPTPPFSPPITPPLPPCIGINIYTPPKKSNIKAKNLFKNQKTTSNSSAQSPELTTETPIISIEKEKLDIIITDEVIATPAAIVFEKMKIPPKYEEVLEYVTALEVSGLEIIKFTQTFFSFYESKNWMVGKNKMQSWTAAIATFLLKDGYVKLNKKWIKNTNDNGKSINNAKRTADSGKEIIRAERRETICKYIANNQREIANALYGEDVVRQVESQSTIYS